jgi:2-keto-4-pentenoate hydratase/2-oxohepta-3-ene-1,7-dioic acid hydratase in catechol pathway
VHAQAKLLDYECELAFVVGKDAKDVTDAEDPLQYVLGYTAADDLSARYWQFDPKLNGGQHGIAKTFDKFAPIGPVIVSPQTIGDAENLWLRTWVDGDLRQDGSTNDLLFGIKDLIRFLTVGKTLRKGTVILTGTPRYISFRPQVGESQKILQG